MRGALPADEAHAAREHAAQCTVCGPRLQLALSAHGAKGADTATVELDSRTAAERLPPAESPLPRGTTVGRYVLLDCIGQGGMGFVYAAYDPELDRRVAVKLLRSSEGDDESARGRLLREAQAMARLNHPNVVTAFDAAVHQGRVFVAMEYVPGVTLKEWLVSQPREVAEVVAVFAEAGRGLSAAHAQQLVHRDMKPANVLIGNDGRVRVTDFGLARAAGQSESPEVRATVLAEAEKHLDDASSRSGSFDDPLTRVGSVVGTIGYMSPEQCLGKPIDARSDQFSFCVCLWEALYGERPFRGSSAAAVTAQVIEGKLPEPPRTRRVPARLHQLLVRGLKVDPTLRFESMQALLDELERDPSSRVRSLMPWVAAAAVAVLAIAGFALWRARSASMCDGLQSDTAKVWNDEQRSALKAAFTATGKAYAAAGWQSTERGLDGYVKSLDDARRDACEQTWVQSTQSQEVLELRDTCFARRTSELQALLAVFAEADPSAVEKSVTAVYGLTPASACADLPALRAQRDEVPNDPEAKALADQLARGRALLNAGQYPKALETLQAAAAKAKTLKLPGLEAQALLWLGLTQQATAKFADALGTLKTSVGIALAAGHDESAARAAINAQAVCSFLEKHDEASLWDELAQSLITRVHGDDRLELERLRAHGIALVTRGQPLEGAKLHEQSLERARKTYGEDHPLLWKAYLDVGTSYGAGKEWDKGIPPLEKALAIKKENQGAEHPDVALILGNLGNAYFFAGQTQKSRDTFEQAVALREKLLGPESPRLVPLLNNLGDSLAKSRAYAEARPQLERAVRLGEKALGPTHAFTSASRISLGELELAEGHLDAAIALFDALLAQQPPATPGYLAEASSQRAMALLGKKQLPQAKAAADLAVQYAEKVGATSGELLLPLTAQGEVLLAMGKSAEAVAPLERALKIADETKAWAVQRADVVWALARAKQSASLAHEAEAVFASSPARATQYAAARAHSTR